MNHQQIREELSKAEQTQKEASESIARLTKLLNEPQGVWRPKDGADYWYFSAQGDYLRCKWVNDVVDMMRQSIGNCFPTKEAAELHVKKLKVIQKLKEMAGVFVPNWKSNNQSKHYLIHEGGAWQVYTTHFSNVSPTMPYFASMSEAQAAITTLGDELNVLLEQ